MHAQEGKPSGRVKFLELHVPHPVLSPSDLREGHCWGVARSSSPRLREPKTKGDQPSSLRLKNLQSTGLVWKQGGDLVLLGKNQMALRMEKLATLQSPGSRKTAQAAEAQPSTAWLPLASVLLPYNTALWNPLPPGCAGGCYGLRSPAWLS